MLAPTLTQDVSISAKQPSQARLALDAGLLLAALTAAALMFFQGGLEALFGACLGAVTGATTHPGPDRISAVISGAFAGLFAGAIGAAFFHSLLFAFF